jgi:hypothetical protein
VSAFAIGFIPTGWARGDGLCVSPLENHPTYRCIIRRDPVPFLWDGPAIMGDTVFEIRVPHDEWPAASAWIDWWEAP